MKTADFDFQLPEELIAHQPTKQRDGAKMLHVNPTGLYDRAIAHLPEILGENDVLVFNNSKVIPARLYGMRDETRLEILLHQEIEPLIWKSFARGAKRLKIADKIYFADNFYAIVQEKLPSGEVVLQFEAQDFWQQLEQYGNMPLPPYIKRASDISDDERYQTIYAKHNGSVAAPTAGLHFTHELLQKLAEIGVAQHFVTLHVGGGTFLPVKVEDTKDHIMHSERGIISEQTAESLNAAKRDGKNIIAVGTTSMRTLESAADANGVLHQFNEHTDIFITPSYQFRFVDKLITNFHLPKSTLFMLVCAFCGTDTMKRAYQHAINNEYRFYSYGDACLLEKF